MYVFIYAKGKEIKALNIHDAKKLNMALVIEGWKHTQTLDACTWIQFLHNDCKDINLLDEVKSLSKINS